MLATLVIVFREVIEAGLIIGIVLAATKGVSGRGYWVSLGIAAGVLGACVVAVFASQIAGLFQGSGQEIFNASILFAAVVMLAWHNSWMASHGKDMAREMQAVGGAVAAGRRPLTALAIVVGVAVLREGSEIVLFLYGIASAGGGSISIQRYGTTPPVAASSISGLMYFGLVAIPMRRLFAVTTALITLLAAGMASQAVAFLQQAGYFPAWRTRSGTPAACSESSLLGRLLHSLIGYSDSPTGASSSPISRRSPSSSS
jgi:high-affinity iron transporter